jgi:hypothetical protein
MGKGSRARPLNVSLEQFDSSFEGIFGKRVPTYMKNRIQEETEMQVRVAEEGKKFGSCGCGRSPTGDCCGWHGLSEEQYKEALEKYLTNQQDTKGKTV